MLRSLPPWCLLSRISNLDFFCSLKGECLLRQPWNDAPAFAKSIQNTDGAGKLYLLNASFLRGQIALVGLIKNVQKVRRPQLLPLKRKERQHSMMLSDTRKDRPLFSGPTQTLEVAHLTLSVLADTFAYSGCISVHFHNTSVVFILL